MALVMILVCAASLGVLAVALAAPPPAGIVTAGMAEAHAQYAGGRPCSVSVSVSLHDVAFDGMVRKNGPPGRYYPGDAVNFIAKWTADRTCSNVRVHAPASYGHAVVASARSTADGPVSLPDAVHAVPQTHYECSPGGGGCGWGRAPVPDIWDQWAEDPESRAGFIRAVSSECLGGPYGRESGCVYGRVELAGGYREPLCGGRAGGAGGRMCSGPPAMVSFSIEGQGSMCRAVPSGSVACAPFIATDAGSASIPVGDPALGIMLERDPFNDAAGFAMMNGDGTFYPDDLMGIGHRPVMEYWPGGHMQFAVSVDSEVGPDVVLSCTKGQECSPPYAHYRTDNSTHVVPRDYGKRGYLAPGAGDYTFHYTMRAYNMGTLGERGDDGYDGVRWHPQREISRAGGSITLHVGPYDPRMASYIHTVWNASGTAASQAPTGISFRYDGSAEGGVTYPERRMRIDGVHDKVLAYNATFALSDGGARMQPYRQVPAESGLAWMRLDVHPDAAGGSRRAAHSVIGNVAMLESAGYGTLVYGTPELGAAQHRYGMFQTSAVNATVRLMPYTDLLGAVPRTIVASGTYTYPAGIHSTVLNVTSYGADGSVRPAHLHVSIEPFEHSARTFRDYLALKASEEQDDARLSEIAGMYAKGSHEASSEDGRLLTYIPRTTHGYLIDGGGRYGAGESGRHAAGLAAGPHSGLPVYRSPAAGPPPPDGLPGAQRGLPGSMPAPGAGPLAQDAAMLLAALGRPDGSMSLPLYAGLGYASSWSVLTLTAGAQERSWLVDAGRAPGLITVAVNADRDNEASLATHNGAWFVEVPDHFGTVTGIDDGSGIRDAACHVRCIIGRPHPGDTVTAYNGWGGQASVTIPERNGILRMPQGGPAADAFPDIPGAQQIGWFALAATAMLAVAWRVSGGSWPFAGGAGRYGQGRF